MVGCLIIHGFTGKSEEIEPLIQHLKKETNWDIIVPILPGHGAELNLKGKEQTMWVEKAEKELRNLKEYCSHVFVIGFSMGAMIAVQLATRIEIERLVLLVPSANLLPIQKILLELRKMANDSRVGKLESNIMYQHSVRKIASTPMKSLLEFFKLIKQSKKYLYNVNVPVLIFQGRQDALVPYKTIYEIDKEVQSSEKEVVLFQDAGHFMCLETEVKEIINRLTLQFLKKH